MGERSPDRSNDGQLAGALVRLLVGVAGDNDVAVLADRLDRDSKAFLAICRANRVFVRTLTALDQRGVPLSDQTRAQLEADRQRVEAGLMFIRDLTELLDEQHVTFTTIKTLDQYPDQGHDIDILLPADAADIGPAVSARFNTTSAPQSLCDRMARKQSYDTPAGLTLEAHGGRLGQVGEHDRLAEAIVAGRRRQTLDGVTTWVPTPAGRVMLAMLQRVFRHFNFRLCDMVNLAHLLRSGEIDWSEVDRLNRLGAIPLGVSWGLAGAHGLLEELGIDHPPPPGIPAPGRCPVRLEYRRDYYRFALLPVVPRVYLAQMWASAIRGRASTVGRIVSLGAIMALVGANIRLAPGHSWWRKLW